MDALQISSSAMTALYLQLIVVVTFPIAALIILKARTKGSIFPFFVGGSVYVVFSVLVVFFLEFITILIGAAPAIDNSPILYCLYHAVVIGFSEETGRFLAFKVFLRGLDNKEVPLFYAIGHAGFDALTIVAVPALVQVSLAGSYAELGIEGMVAQNAQRTSEEIVEIINKINGITIGQGLLTLGVQLLWFALHVSLSVIIFYGVKKKYTKYLWVCIGIRALSSIPSSLISKHVFSNEIVGIVIFTVIVLFVCYPAIKLFSNQEKDYPNFFSLYNFGNNSSANPL